MRVLAQYGLAVAGLRWVPVEGGFSGALVWRGEDTSPVFALKAHPPHVTPEKISQVHAWMGRAAHLPFVPAVIPTIQHTTFAVEAGRVWELVRWMPGEPGLTTPARLTTAVAALAQLHHAWKPSAQQFAPCPGVSRRLDILLRLPHRHIATHTCGDLTFRTPPSVRSQDSADELLNRAADTVSRLAPPALRALLPWAERPLPLQPCLCDVHADHVLFDGDELSGVIDYSATKLDHVAVDLARLLGSVALDDAEFTRAVSEYQTRREFPVETKFVRLLDLTGTLCAAATWHRRLAAEPPELLATSRFRERLEHIVRRLESAPPALFWETV